MWKKQKNKNLLVADSNGKFPSHIQTFLSLTQEISYLSFKAIQKDSQNNLLQHFLNKFKLKNSWATQTKGLV